MWFYFTTVAVQYSFLYYNAKMNSYSNSLLEFQIQKRERNGIIVE